MKCARGFSGPGGGWLENGGLPPAPGASPARRNSPSSCNFTVMRFVGRTATAEGAPTGIACTSTVCGLPIPETDGGCGIPDACELGSIAGGKFSGFVLITCVPCWVITCCGGGNCCCGIPGGGHDTTIGGPEGAVGCGGRNIRFCPSPPITVGIGWLTLYANTGPVPVGLAAPAAERISAGATL